MRVKECPDNWKGKLLDFIRDYVLHNLPDRSLAQSLHLQIKALALHRSKESVPYFVRGLGGARAPRGVRTDYSDVYNCDNAPAIWLYHKLMETNEINEYFLINSLKSMKFPLRDVGGREGEKEGYIWAKVACDPLGYRRNNGGRWKLCHIFSVKAGLPDSVNWYFRRFVRLIHPFNYFLFPKPIRYGKGYYTLDKDLGESLSVCLLISNLMRERFGEQLWNEFLELAGVEKSESPGSSQDMITGSNFEINWSDEDASGSSLINRSTDSLYLIDSEKTCPLSWEDFKIELVELASDALDGEAIVAPGNFKKSPYLYVRLPDERIGYLNSDCKIRGIREFLRQLESKNDGDSQLEYVANRFGKKNKIIVEGFKEIPRFPFYVCT
jgi:hypothetical protein